MPLAGDVLGWAPLAGCSKKTEGSRFCFLSKPMEKKIPPTQQMWLLPHSPEPCACDGPSSIPAPSKRLHRGRLRAEEPSLHHSQSNCSATDSPTPLGHYWK